ncbi:hypothetical protein FGADI_5662 [Fusarium gaditjirri]|uniref:Uncharacterized protein n=1 Tax=Fusarium gaditjirri TaxID=282569 RepID=A0A8H4WXR1_9HYPO|nr:hypothetical protein FGADI_5662 [Fusarium gaditjirri]
MSDDTLSKRLQPDINGPVSCHPLHSASTPLELTWQIQESAIRRFLKHKRRLSNTPDDSLIYHGPGYVVDNAAGDEAPEKKKRRTDNSRIGNSSKGKPRVTPYTGCISRMADNGPEHACYYTDSKPDGPSCYDCTRNRRECNQPVGNAAKLGEVLQKMALRITNGNTKSHDWSTKMEWTRKARAAKASVKVIQETPGVAPDRKLQNRSEESTPKSVPDGKVPHSEGSRFFSNNPTPIIKSEQHETASPQSMSIPRSITVPQLQEIPHYGPPPHESQLQGSIARLEVTMNRVADSLEANNSLLRQLMDQSVKNTNDLLEVNRQNGARLDTTNNLLRQMLDKKSPPKEVPKVDLLIDF